MNDLYCDFSSKACFEDDRQKYYLALADALGKGGVVEIPGRDIAAVVESSGNEPAISIITCSQSDERFAAFQRGLQSVSSLDNFEVIRIRNARSLCQGYNRGLAAAGGEIAVFCHDDLEILNSGFRPRLLAHLERYDLVGVAGSVLYGGYEWTRAGWPHLRGMVAHPGLEDGSFNVAVYGVDGAAGGGAMALDGVFMAARRDVALKIGFDENTFDGFHFYDMDFSYRAYLDGCKIGVANDLGMLHHSIGNADVSWHIFADRFLEKHETSLKPVRKGPDWNVVGLKSREEVRKFFEAVVYFAGLRNKTCV